MVEFFVEHQYIVVEVDEDWAFDASIGDEIKIFAK